MGGLATGADLIGRLLGPEVSGVMARLDGPDPEPLHPEESRLVAAAVPRRLREFLVGRSCAHAALAAIGCDEAVIGVGPKREPLWPAGIAGSIAHGGDWAGAVVVPTDHALGLGLDIEPVEPPLPPAVEELVLTIAERKRLRRWETEARHAAKVVFTAKECVYKALFPSTGWFLEHADVEIDLDLAGGRWRATLADPFPMESPGPAGRFEVADDHIVTAVLVAPIDAMR